MTDQTETARELLWRHQLPEDVIDGALALFAQELAGKIRARFDGSIIDDIREQDADLISPENWARTEPAVPAPATDQTKLRDRIAEALYAHDHPGHLVPLNETGMQPAYQGSADAVLSVLPETDQPGLLAKVDEATATLRRIRSTIRTLKDRGATGYAYHQAITGDLAGPRPDDDEAPGPSRMADETQQPEEQAAPDARPGTTDYTLVQRSGLLRRSEDVCPGFPDRCPNLRTVEPETGVHLGGVRCGCADEAAAAQQPKEA
jgi:hypothetical protein